MMLVHTRTLLRTEKNIVLVVELVLEPKRSSHAKTLLSYNVFPPKHAYTTSYRGNLVLVVVLVLESKGLSLLNSAFMGYEA